MHSDKNINPILKWWMTPKLPAEHIFIKPEDRPKGAINSIKIYSRKWVLHPLKRRIAKYYLILLQKCFGLKVVGITGSAGKTTTKEMLASILKQRGETIYSYANIDPVYNIPTTILKCSPSTKYLILEMGVEYHGEMDFYLWLAKPDIGIITNIYPTHIEYLGDVNGVFKEKSKLVLGLSNDDCAILNRGSVQLTKLKDKLKAKTLWFGDGTFETSSLIKFTEDFKTKFRLIINQNTRKSIDVVLPILGAQFVENALAAAVCADYLRFSITEIKKGLESFKSQEHRMQVIKHKSGAIILDDSYNNNPRAAENAIATLISLGRNKDKVVVFGDMLELGNWESKYHIELGEYLGKTGLTFLVCVGKASKITAQKASIGLGKSRVVAVEKTDEILKYLKTYLRKNTMILIKGSRSIGLDKLVSELV